MQEGLYNWIKIAILDTVQIDLDEGSMVWLLKVYDKQGNEGWWNSIHAFVESGLLHTSVAKAVEMYEEYDEKFSVSVSEGFKLTGIKKLFSLFNR